MKDFLTDEEMQKLEANETPDFISDEEMAKIEGSEVEPVTMVENEPTPIADMMVGLNRGIESVGEAITSPIQKLFTAPPNQDVVVPEELDLGSMQAVRDRQAMLPPKASAEPGYVPPAGITEGLEAALPIAYQATKKGISGAVQALAENAPVTSFPTAPIAEYMQGVGEGAQAEIEKTMQEKQIRSGTAGAVATDVAASMAQFLPIAGMSIIAPSVAPAGLAFLATVSGGDKYQKAKEAGFGEGEALAQGIAYGAAEAIGEKIGLDYLLAAAKNPAVMSGVKTIFAQGLKQAGVEGAEEGLTQIIQNATDIVAKKARPETKGEAPTILQDVPYAMGVGAVAGGLTGGGLGALQSMMGGQQQPQTEAPKEEVQPEEPTATEPAPQNMEATTEFLTRKPAVTFGEAERLRGEEVPTGGMTINRQARPTVTFGGEGERTGEAIPEGKGMTIQPTAPSNKLDQLFKREPDAAQSAVISPYSKGQTFLDYDGKELEIIGQHPNGEYMTIEKGQARDGKGFASLWPEKEIQNVMSKQEAIKKQVVADKNRKEAEQQATQEWEKRTAIPDFYADKPPMEQGKAKKYLTQKINYRNENGEVDYGILNKEIIERKAGIPDNKIGKDSKGYYIEQNNNTIYRINKIGADYFEFIRSKTSPQPRQATEVAPKDITPQPAEPTAVKTPETDIKNLYKYNEESQNNIMLAQQFESASIERPDGNPAIKTIIYRWEPKPNGNGGKLLKDVFLDNKKESSEIYNEYENKIDAVKDAYNNISTNRSDRKSFFIDKDVKKYDTEVQNTKTKNERRAKITEQVQSEVDNKVQEIEQIKNDLNTKYHTELAREYKAAGILFEKVKPSKYRKTFKGQIQPIVTKENQKQIKEISSRIMDKIKKENKVVFDEITNFKADDYKNKLIEERTALSEGKPVPPEVLAEYPDLKVEQKAEAKPKIPANPPNSGFSDGEWQAMFEGQEEVQPRPKSGPGMFGGATVQNAYEKVEPTLKKGADMLFKKGKQAYETVKRNADLTRDMGRVIDITEKEGRPVETEAPIRPRIGLFNLQNVYDAVFGKPKTSDDRITVGDPTIGKKINDMYERTNKAEVKMKQEAESKRQTIGGAARQSLIDLFAPYLDIAKKDSATYEKALASLHDVFYIPSGVEAFLNNYRDQILSPIKKANKTYRDYSAYRMAKWTLTGRAKVKSPLSLKEAQDFVDSIDPQTRKLFEDITTDFHEKTWKPLLQEIEDSGLKDDKVIKFIMDKENYATFFPAKQMGLSYGSREYKPSGEIFKLTEEGFQGDIQDVLTSLMQKGIAVLTHANINMAKLTGIDILKTMSPKDITPAKQSFKGYRKVKDTNGNEIEMPIMEFDEPAPNSQMALLTVREDGKAKGYYVPKQFAEAFDNALGDPSSFADSLRYYSNLTQAIKNVWIDYNPPWQLFTNMVRDIPAAAIEMPGFKKPIKFVAKVVKKAPAAIGDYVKFVGEVGQQITGYDRKAFEKQVTQLLKEKKLLSSKDVQHLGDYNITVFDRIQNAFDTFPKEGESQGFLQQLKAFGKDVERLTKVAFDETLQESGEFTQNEIKNMTRRGGSPAFGVRGGGKAFEVIKVPLMFYNAVKEGWRAGKYFYQKDPAGFLIKASVPLSIFSFGAAAAAGAFGDEWKKAYLAIKKSDRENKLVYPLWWTDEGNIKYLALSVPQFLKPFMIMINELASSNPSLAEGLADAMSNEMPSLNPVLDITKTLTSYGGNKPPIDRFGNPIMTQDQWTAGGSEKALALLKSISNQNLFGSLFKFPVKPTDPKKDFVTSLYDATFGKIMKESFAPAIDTEEQDVNAAKARLLARQIIEIEKENPEEANRLRDEMRKLGYTPSRQFMRSVRRETNIEREKEAGTITDREAYEKRLRQQPKTKRKKYNELFNK